MKLLASLAALVAAAVLAGGAGATTEPEMLMHVKVTLTAKKVSLSSSYAARGLEVQFNVRNSTSVKRTFSVAGKTIVVPARKLRITAISFQARGKFPVVSRAGRSRITTTFRVQ